VNGFTDLVIEKDGERIAVEIETGKSDWKRNIEKNIKRGFGEVILLFTNIESMQLAQSKATGIILSDKVKMAFIQNLSKF
jgi:hypothetical protein